MEFIRNESSFYIILQRDTVLLQEMKPLGDANSTSHVHDGKQSTGADSCPSEHFEESQCQNKNADVTLKMDYLLAVCLIAQLISSQTFRNNFRIYLSSIWETVTAAIAKQTVMEVQKSKNVGIMSCSSLSLAIILNKDVNANLFQIGQDISWSKRMVPQVNIRIHLEDVFSWLSTLGGAYSSLGDSYAHCSSRAGKISLQQLYLAWSLGEPLLESRCKLFLAQSLMQRGFLRHAKIIIRKQYEFATSAIYGCDDRLITMCLGIWHRLKYFYLLRRERLSRRKCGAEERNGLTNKDRCPEKR